MLFKTALNKTLSNPFAWALNNRNYGAIASVLERANVGEKAEIKGWVKNLRNQKGFIFADVSDGSSAKKLQIVIPKNLNTDSLTYGSSVHITGQLSKSPRGQLELVADEVKVLGDCVVADGYPFNPRTTHPPDYIRQYLHLRSRTNYISAILRIRNAVTKHIHDYFQSKNYLHIHTPILTSNDCEGAGEVFKIQPDNAGTVRAIMHEGRNNAGTVRAMMHEGRNNAGTVRAMMHEGRNNADTVKAMMQEGRNNADTVKAMMQEGRNNDTVYFGEKTFLTVSGQLHLEAICRGMGNVYTLGPTFRAENSRSRLHLSEFYMLEAELAFCNTIEELQNEIENLLKYVLIKTRDSNEADLHLIDKDNLVPNWMDKEFVILSYDEAKSIVEKKGIANTEEGMNKEQELALVEHCNGVPVFVVNWPKEQKSFYMKECPHDRTKVSALDLLAPITGEVVGGSLREDSYELLKSKLPSDRLNWYLELRKFGNIPTGGFGLGLERLLQVMCGVKNIKDTLPFPRWPHNCDM